MEHKTPKEIGRTVSVYFKENRISQEEAANRLGFSSKQVIANQLSGKKFGKRTAKKYAQTFGFNEEFLLYGKGTLTGEQDSIIEKLICETEALQSIILSHKETIKNLSSSGTQ